MQRRLWTELLKELEGIIPVYDTMNKLMSLGFEAKIRKALIENLVDITNDITIVADVGCGPGTLVEYIAVLKPAYVLCLDPSTTMLGHARRRLTHLNHIIDYVVCVAEALPLRGEALDAAIAAFSMRDFTNWVKGLVEMYRVARVVAVLDIFRVYGLKAIAQLCWWGVVVPVLSLTVKGARPRAYIMLLKTILSWIDIDTLREAFESLGLKTRVREFLSGFAAIVIGCKHC